MNYKKILINTMLEKPEYMIEELLDRFELEKLIIRIKEIDVNTQQEVLEGFIRPVTIDSTLNCYEQISKCINESDACINSIEEFEFEKSYRYSALFQIEEKDIKKIEEYIFEKNNIFNEKYSKFETLDEDYFFYEKENSIYIKINKTAEKYFHDKEELRRYKIPIIIAIKKDINILEVRLDENRFKEIEGIAYYFHEIDYVINKMKKDFNILVKDINFTKEVRDIVRGVDKRTNVIVTGQYMKSFGEDRSELSSSFVKKESLAILDHLKDLMLENEKLFNSSIEIKNVLEEFINEMEITLDYPAVTLKFIDISNEVKFTNRNIVKYTLLHHMGYLEYSERMDYVTDYFIQV